MDMRLPECDNYQGKVAPNCFQSHIKKFCLMSGLKLALSNLTSFLPNNLAGLYIYICNIYMYIFRPSGRFLPVRICFFQRNQDGTIIRIWMELVFVFIHDSFFIFFNDFYRANLYLSDFWRAGVSLHSCWFFFLVSDFCIQDAAEPQTITIGLLFLTSN